ncbi:cell division protein FtsQ/DivIB [Magnetovibrio sp.]|uniref:cell division protein FtsQ/DivIB n=1 Tax=Magnetovibrio sp. TaxID=2024836 RepID=UPI002F9270E6
MKKMLTRLMTAKLGGEQNDTDVLEPASTPRRKRVVPLWRRPQTIAALSILAIATVGGTGAWAWTSGHVQEVLNSTKWMAVKASTDLGFTVQDVLVTGRGETQRDDLLEAMAIARGTPILTYDFQAAKARVESLPWVLQARIERLLPDTLVVHIIERHPMALWQNQGQFSLIDDNGVVITRDELGRFADLIHVVGEDAPDHIGGLLELLETQPELKSLVKAAVRVGGRRWDLSLDGGIDVRLPEADAPKALARLAAFEEESGVLGRDVRVLDLRVPDRVIVRRNPNALRRPESKPGQET